VRFTKRGVGVSSGDSASSSSLRTRATHNQRRYCWRKVVRCPASRGAASYGSPPARGRHRRWSESVCTRDAAIAVHLTRTSRSRLICPSCQFAADRAVDRHPNHQQSPSHPVPTKRGVSRSSQNVGAGGGGRSGVERRTTKLRTAKSCGPDIPTLISSGRQCYALRPAMVTTSPAHQGEREGNR